MTKFLKDFLQLFALGIVVSLGLNWLLGKPYVLDAHNIIMSLTISVIVLWVAFETKRRAQ
jgi:hypothetical protein